MLRAFGHRVVMCCDMLGVVGLNLTIFKLEPTTPNMSQHIATGWLNACNMLRRTMLRYVMLACCDRLAGALNLTFLAVRSAFQLVLKSTLVDLNNYVFEQCCMKTRLIGSKENNCQRD